MQNKYQQLCEEIELQLGRTMHSPQDFKWLSERIFERVHETLSPTTLMRLWGYRKGVVPRQITVDILARFLGYADYWEFESKNNNIESLTKDKEKSVGLENEETELENDEGRPKGKRWMRRWWILGGTVFAVAVGIWWLFGKCGNADTNMPAGAENWTWALRNPQCDADSLDVWTFVHGGWPLDKDGTLTYFMKDFDACQVVHGLPAGEYELRVRAWHLPSIHETALYDYEHATDKEDGRALSRVEIYAGPFAQRVKNFVSEVGQDNGNYENVLRFVVLEDSVRIGFRSDENRHSFSQALADDFRLYLLRRAKTEEDYRQMAERRDSALCIDNARPKLKTGDRIPQMFDGKIADLLYNYIKNGDVTDCWKGQEAPMPEGWTTEQDASRCRLVNRTDVGRGMGDSNIYLEYRSEEPAKTGLLIGHRVFLEAGTYHFAAIFFAQSDNEFATNVYFAAKGYESSCPTPPLMDWRYFTITLREDQEVTVGLWAPEGCDVRRAGICKMTVWAVKQ